MAAEPGVYRKALESFAAREGFSFEIEPYDEIALLGDGRSFRWASAVVSARRRWCTLRENGPTEEDACRRLAETVAWRSGISLAEFLVREDVCGG